MLGCMDGQGVFAQNRTISPNLKCMLIVNYIDDSGPHRKRLSNHMGHYFIHNIENITKVKRRIVTFYQLNDLISNLMPATGLKKVGTGATEG